MGPAFVVLVGTLAGTAAVASARAASESERCAAAVARAAPEFFARSTAALAACRRVAARGGQVDCLGRTTARPLRNAVRDLEGAIRRKCSDAAVSSLGWGGDCAGVRTVDALPDASWGATTAMR
jgi:hypothetical protein